MATKLYFHNVSNQLSGSFPTGEQGAGTANNTAVGADTMRTMTKTIGTSQVVLSFSDTTDNTRSFMGYFCSPPLRSAQTVGGGVMSLLAGSSESNLGANFWINSLNVYVWRPSTNTKVGTIRDNSNGNSLGGSEATIVNTVYPDYITGITSTAVSAQTGDVVICEIWNRIATGATKNYTCSFAYDGAAETTNEATIETDIASFLLLTETLTFSTDTKTRSFGVII